jgi:hypothetical protein
MALVPYTITAIERDFVDAETSGRQVVIGAACSMYIQPQDTVVLLYDDANGSNGSTAKTTNSNGQVTVYIEAGEYRLETNGISRFVQVGRADKMTTTELIASTKVYQVGDTVYTDGFLTAGDSGGGSWRLTAVTGTASQTPSQLGNALFNDGNGSQWGLVNREISVVSLGGVVDGVTNNTLVTNAVVAWGGKLTIPVGTYLTENFLILSTTLEVMGANQDLTIIRLTDNAVQNVFTMTGTAKLKLSNLTVDQNFANNSGGHGIRSGGCDALVIDNVTIQNCAFYGIGFQAGTSKGVNLSNFTIKNTNSDGIDIKDYNNNNECIFITNYRAENVSIIDDDDVALDVRGEVCVNSITVQTVTTSRGIRLRQGGGQGRAGFGTINNFIFKGHGAGSPVAIQLAADAGNFVFNNVSAKDCLQVVLQDNGSVGGIVNNISSSGIFGDGMSIGGADLIVNGYSAKNTTGSSRLCDVESTSVNFNLCNFFIDETTASATGIRVIAGAVNTNFSNGSIRGGNIGDAGTGTVQDNIRLI